MKLVICSILVLFMMGCSFPFIVSFNGEEKRCIQGVVLDQNKMPIAGIPVDILARSPDDCPLINSTITDQNGNFEVCMSKASPTPYLINLNRATIFEGTCYSQYNFNGSNKEYGSKVVYINEVDFNDRRFILEDDQAVLPTRTTLALTIKSDMSQEFVYVDYSEELQIAFSYEIGIKTNAPITYNLQPNSNLSLRYYNRLTNLYDTTSINITSGFTEATIEL